MVILKKATDLKVYLSQEISAGKPVGFIPTMGALHDGHLSLLKQAKENGNLTVCSIFLNPTQFNDKKDYEKYPVSTENDIELLVKAGCDVLFLPAIDEIYPNGAESIPTYDFGYLDTILEGQKRPGHFKGVGQVVARLLEIVNPNYLYLGQKDYQQCMVIKRLAQILDLKNLEIVICPTLREPDGLAMSSRNRRLTDPQRAIAGILYQCLVSIQAKQADDQFTIVRKECEDLLKDKGLETEYVALADSRNLSILDDYQKDVPMVALIAAKIGEIRLIDNLMLNQ